MTVLTLCNVMDDDEALNEEKYHLYWERLFHIFSVTSHLLRYPVSLTFNIDVTSPSRGSGPDCIAGKEWSRSTSMQTAMMLARQLKELEETHFSCMGLRGETCCLPTSSLELRILL